jgi:hypothetical protein
MLRTREAVARQIKWRSCAAKKKRKAVRAHCVRKRTLGSEGRAAGRFARSIESGGTTNVRAQRAAEPLTCDI